MTAQELAREMLKNLKKYEAQLDKDKATHFAFYEKGFIEGQLEALETMIRSMELLGIE